MKGILIAGLTASLLTGSFFANADEQLPQSNIMGNHASVGVGYTSNEGESGYYAELRWQFNKYAEVSLGVNSYLNSQRFDSEILLGDRADGFTPNNFRPRHNTYQFSTTFRYPFVLSESTVLAPYVEFGISKLSTKTIEFREINSSGGTGGGNAGQSEGVELFSFEDLDSFKFGAGVQMAFNNAHKVTLGALGYSNDEDFNNLSVDDNQVGGTLRYEYRPTASFGYVLKLDTVDQFGGALISVGVSWAFN